jgi:type IV secretion system protein VirB11
MTEAARRQLDMLKTALGSISEYLDSETITEVMLNPNGTIWVNEMGKGMYKTEITLNNDAADRVIRLIATAAGMEINQSKPSLAAKLPHWGARVQASIPPYSVDGPTFNFRMPARKIYTLDEYVESEIMTQKQADFLKLAIKNKDNILVSGGTGSGKTTLTNALLNEIAGSNDRVIMIEDNLELQCPVENLVRKLVNPPELTLSKAIFDSLREYPTRIIVGEVRDHSAYDLITIWNTGHPGNICTLHADSAEDSLGRLNRLAQQKQPHFDFREEINKAVGVCIHLKEDLLHMSGRQISKVLKINSVDATRMEY